MLRWAAVFFIVAVIAAVLGFTGIAGTAATIAKVLAAVPGTLRPVVAVRAADSYALALTAEHSTRM